MTGRHTRLVVLTVVGVLTLTVLAVAQVLTPRDIANLRIMVEKGNADAQFMLGMLHETGDGVPEDRQFRSRMWILAADQGHARARSNISGTLQERERAWRDYGDGPYKSGSLSPDCERMRATYTRLAEQDAGLQPYRILGYMYLGHRPDDPTIAIQKTFPTWRNDNVSAEGCSVSPQDFTLAYMWLNIGASRYRDETTFMERDGVEREAGWSSASEDYMKAQQFARKWDAAHPREP